MIYFSFYTICISEHYRKFGGYIPTLIQQVSVILKKNTITVEFQSQVHRITNYFVFMLEIFYHKDTKTHYLVIILLYQARGSEPQVVLRDYLIVSVSYTISSSFRKNSTTYQKVSAIS